MQTKFSWKTTMGGIGALLVALGSIGKIIVDYVNGNGVDPTQLMIAFAAISSAVGLIAARDNDRTSEDVGLK
jgi:hypothetical protein